MPDEISRYLAQFVATARRGDLPATVAHAAKRAILNFVAAGFAADQIASIVVRGNSLLKARADRQVTTGREAQVCLSHTVAVVLRLGRAGPPEYTDVLVNDTAIRGFADRVVMQVDDKVAVEAAEVIVSMAGGREFKAFIPHARGSLRRPMTDAEIEEKLSVQARDNVPVLDTRRLIETVWDLDRAADAAVAIRHAAAK